MRNEWAKDGARALRSERQKGVSLRSRSPSPGSCLCGTGSLRQPLWASLFIGRWRCSAEIPVPLRTWSVVLQNYYACLTPSGFPETRHILSLPRPPTHRQQPWAETASKQSSARTPGRAAHGPSPCQSSTAHAHGGLHPDPVIDLCSYRVARKPGGGGCGT